MAALPKMHLNHHTARSIVHGPLLYGGINLPNLYTVQGTSELKIRIGHLWARDKTYKLLLVCHGYLQLLIGIQSNFLNSR
jgi:hypothetical protein